MGTSFRTCIIIVTIHLISIITAQEMDKRGPQGFLGMRGKKFDSTEQFYKRKPQFFVGVKGKKTIYDILESPDVAGYYKRAPMGFMGMRGKKDMSDEYQSDLPGKGGSLIGQIDYSSADNDNYPLLNELLHAYLNKVERPLQTYDSGEDERISNEIEKRAASIHQFFGVRGKKSLEKRMSDVNFRGKFIGVRGKKDLKNDAAQEIKFLVNGPLPKRKGQMGFVGMRGKKWNAGEMLYLFTLF